MSTTWSLNQIPLNLLYIFHPIFRIIESQHFINHLSCHQILRFIKFFNFLLMVFNYLLKKCLLFIKWFDDLIIIIQCRKIFIKLLKLFFRNRFFIDYFYFRFWIKFIKRILWIGFSLRIGLYTEWFLWRLWACLWCRQFIQFLTL